MIDDKAFVVNVDQRPGEPFTRPWVEFLGGWENQSLDDSTGVYIGNSREAELRLFVVRQGASFYEIEREMGRFIDFGFRPTTLRSLVAFCNSKGARDLGTLDKDIVFLVSGRAIMEPLKKGAMKSRAFHSALVRKDKTVVGILSAEDIVGMENLIVLLEAPLPH